MEFYFQPDLVNIAQIEYLLLDTEDVATLRFDFSLDRGCIDTFIKVGSDTSSMFVSEIPILAENSSSELKSFQEVWEKIEESLSLLPQAIREATGTLLGEKTPEEKILTEIFMETLIKAIENLPQAISIWKFPDKTYLGGEEIEEVKKRFMGALREFFLVREEFKGSSWELLYSVLAEEAQEVLKMIEGEGPEKEDAYVLGDLYFAEKEDKVLSCFRMEYLPADKKMILRPLQYIGSNTYKNLYRIYELDFDMSREEPISFEEFCESKAALENFFQNSVPPSTTAYWHLREASEPVVYGEEFLPPFVLEQLYDAYRKAYFIANEQQIPQYRVVEYVSTFLAQDADFSRLRDRAIDLLNKHLRP